MWRLGANHTDRQWQNKMLRRGWTAEQIQEAIDLGQRFAAANNAHPGNGAARCVHPTTGRSLVLDDTTDEVIPLGGDGYVY